MVAQCHSFVVLPKQVSVDQDRNNLINEALEWLRRVRCHNREAIAGAAFEPGLKVTGNLLGGSDQHSVAGANGCVVTQLAKAEIASLRNRLQYPRMPLHHG